MTNERLRLLNLTYAFPPGVSGRFPALNPSGHVTDTRLAQALARQADVSTVGLLAREVFGKLEPRDDSIGLEHELLLWDRRPEIWHRWHSWRRLRRFYLEKAARNEMPDVVLVKNPGPVYGCFIRWLRKQRPHPLLVLLLGDAGTLGQKIPLLKRLRYAFKPMVTLDESKMITWFDACIASGFKTRQYFEPRGVPWIWMPPSFCFHYDPPSEAVPATGPIRFGYFGTLSKDAGVWQMIQEFLNAKVPGTLHVCGHGKSANALQELAQKHSNFHFDGLLSRPSDCLPWAQQVDVLVNPRPATHGLENAFPSKIFEYAMTGKAVLSTRTAGADQVLGAEGIYLATDDLAGSLRRKFCEVTAMDRAELHRRGAAIRNRILKEFTWDNHACRMIEFMAGVLNTRS